MSKIGGALMNGTKRVVIYSRVSTSEQNPEIQMEELKTYSKLRGWNIVEEISDFGFSGSTDKRPGYKKLIELVRARRIDVVVVVKLDRLFRSVKHIVAALSEFSDLGVEFVSLRDQVDMTSASGKLLVHLLAAFSEFERSLIVERTLMGLQHARNKRVKLGRPREHDFNKIKSLYDQGVSLRKIQREMGCSLGVVYRAIGAAPKTPQKDDENEPLETRVCSGK